MELEKGNQYYYEQDGKVVIFLYWESGKAIVEDKAGNRLALYPEDITEFVQVI